MRSARGCGNIVASLDRGSQDRGSWIADRNWIAVNGSWIAMDRGSWIATGSQEVDRRTFNIYWDTKGFFWEVFYVRETVFF